MVIEIINKGEKFYSHTAWANDAAGTDFSLDEFEDALLIGTYLDRSPVESEDPSRYAWRENVKDEGVESGGYDDFENRIEDIEASISNNAGDISGTQLSADSAIGNPNLLLETNEGVTNYSVTSGYSIEETVDSIGENTEFINCVKVTCNTPTESGMLFFNATSLRTILANEVDDNTYTISMNVKMSALFELDVVAVQDPDGSNQQLTFEPLHFNLDDEDIAMDDEWTYYEATTQCAADAESGQMLCLSLANMPAGASMVIANLKIEAGAIATPWRESVEEVGNKLKNLRLNVLEVERVLAHKVKADEFEANSAIINSLEVRLADIEEADVSELRALMANLTTVTARDAELINAEIDDLQAKVANVTDLSAEELEAINADIEALRANVAKFNYVSADKIEALAGYIKSLDVEKISAKDADFKYAKIDKSNITQAWIEELLVKGKFLANDVNGATGSFSKYLTGVKIIGALIEAETLRAKALILQGKDGIYRRLNIDALGEAKVDSDPKYNEGIDGSVLVKESITADKINVAELFAQDIISTGDFNMGGKGALVYDSFTDELSMRVKKLLIEAEEAATKKDIDDIQIGGRNLIRNSHNLIFSDYYFYPLSGVMLITSDGHILKDVDGRYITVEGS